MTKRVPPTEQIQRYITIDTSGKDRDTIELEVRGTVLITQLGRESRYATPRKWHRLPNGTRFHVDDIQLAFQNEHIKVYGVCILEADYLRAGHPELAKLARSARGAR